MAACAGLSAAEIPQGGTIVVGEVRVVGLQQWNEARVLEQLGVRGGRAWDQFVLQRALTDDIKALNKLGWFSDVTGVLIPVAGGQGKVDVRYTVRELPSITEVRVVGVAWYEEDGFTKDLQTKKQGWLNPLMLDADQRAIQRTLQEKGYRNAQVTARTIEVPPGSGLVEVVFTINRGLALKVGRIVYDGLPAELPRSLMQEDKILLNKKDEAYQADLLEFDGRAVVRRLQDLGWLDAKLERTDVEVTDFIPPLDDRRWHGPGLAPDNLRNDRVVLVYHLIPGHRYRLGKVSFVGQTSVSEEELLASFTGTWTDGRSAWWRVTRKILGIDLDRFRRYTFVPGDWFVADRVYGSGQLDGDIGAIERARRVLGNRGHAAAQVNTDRRLDTTRHIVDLVVHINEGGIYTVGRVDIRGNDTTRDAVVRRGMYLHPGNLWSDDDLDESQRQVSRLGIFKGPEPSDRPRLDRQFDERRPSQADIVVDLRESPTASLTFQAGYSTASGVFAQFGFSERNFDAFTGGWPFRGGGQILDLTAFVGQERNAFTASHTNVHLFDGPWSLTTSGSREDSTMHDWRQITVTPGLTVGRAFFNNDVVVNLGYSYSDLNVSQVSVLAPDDAVAGSYYQNSFRMSQTFDRLDDRFLPTRGLKVTLREVMNGIVLPATYPTWEYALEADRFVSLATNAEDGSTVLHLSANWHEIRPIDSDGTVPFYQRVYGGGPSPRHRGFDWAKQGPRSINRNGYLAYDGGTKEGLFTAEVFIPLMGRNDQVRGVLFSDIGQVWGQKQSPTFGDLQTAVGFGVRFPVSIPVSLDFAFLLNPRDGESNTQIHFGIGQVRF